MCNGIHAKIDTDLFLPSSLHDLKTTDHMYFKIPTVAEVKLLSWNIWHVNEEV